jgi:O-antigen/teichoic acid export membrane protein
MSDADQAIRDVVKGASLVYVGLFVELLVAFVAQVIAARYLSVSDFGGITTGTALLDVGAIVGGLGLAAGLTRYLPRVGDDEKRALTMTAVAVTAVTSFAIGLAISLNASFVAREVFGDASVTTSIRIFGAAIPFAALLNVAVGGIRGQKQALHRVIVKNLLHPIARIVLVVGVVTYGLGQTGMASAYAIPYVVSAALALVLLHRSLPRSPVSFDTDLTAEVASYSLPFTITRVAGFVYRSLDIFLILHFMGSFAVGVYGVAYAATSFMGMLSTAFNFLGTPVASELEHGGDVEEVMAVFRSVARWLVVGSVCVFIPIGIFSTEFITVIYSERYASGGLALTILAAGFAVKNVLMIHGPILEALGRSRILSLNSVAAAVANLVVNVLLIPRYGIVGAAVATVLSFLLRDGLATLQVRQSLGATSISWPAIGPSAVAVPFVGGIAVFIAPSIPGTFLWLVGVSGLLAVAYTALVLIIFGLSSTEVMILRSVEEKYGVDLGPLDPVIEFLSER